MKTWILLCCVFSLHADDLIFHTTKDDISIDAQILQPAQCTDLFFHNLHAYHLIPLQLTITNNTTQSWMISGNSIEELALVPPHVITNDMIFKYDSIEHLVAYGCAVTGWISALASMHFMSDYLPDLEVTTKYISASATLISFLYQARRFRIRRSHIYKQTQARIMQYGLSGTNVIIKPNQTIEKVMFLNSKSYAEPPEREHTFFYLFTVTLYNLADSSDTISLPVEVPKIYLQ